jgi:hypothetical protein
MAGDLIDILIVELERRFPRFRKTASIGALVVLVLIVGFGLYALRSLSTGGTLSIVKEPPSPGVRPPIEQGASVFEQLWSAPIGTIQDLAVMRTHREDPLQFLALTRNTVARFDPQGRLLSEINVPRGTARLIADLHGRLGFFLAASTDFYWNWKDLGYVAQAHHLTAIDPQGRTLWTYTLAADRSSSPFEVLLVDADGDRSVQILVDVGARTVCFDTAGRELWSMPDQFRSWMQVDSEGDDRPEVLVLRWAGRKLEVADFGADRRLTSRTLLERGSISAWHVARMDEHAEPTLATFAMSSTPNAAGKTPEIFEVLSMTGAPIGTATLPWPTRPIVIRPLTTIDSDGDGVRAWIAAGDDGVLYMFSADARGEETHHTGVYIRRLTVVSMSESGDWLILGTERGLQVWKRRANFPSTVD